MRAFVEPRWPAILLLLVAVAIATRAQTFGNPVIGYDEQFYLVVGDRMLHGAVPYVDIFDRKPIGLFLIYGGIRLLGGEGTIEYQLVAFIFVVATAAAIYRLARTIATTNGALAAAIVYLVWLDFLEGEGGQAPVFYNLPVVIAAWLTMRASSSAARMLGRTGSAAMLAVGIAMQIKYTAVFEGCWFGCVLLWTGWRSHIGPRRLAPLGLLWVAVAVAPTAVAWVAYAAIDHQREFVFANFVSMFGKSADPLATVAAGLATIAAILAPILICAVTPPTTVDPGEAVYRRFFLYWQLAAITGMLVMKSFASPHYALPVLVPATIAAAARFGAPGWGRRVAWTLVGAGFLGGQVALAALRYQKGGASEAHRIAAVATPRHGCLFIYDGYPALYRLTHSCLLSKFAFPGHLNMANEGSATALGVDPSAEVARIMAARPDTVVDEDPVFERGNRATHKIVLRDLARDYHLALRLRTGAHRYRLVYRRNGD